MSRSHSSHSRINGSSSSKNVSSVMNVINFGMQVGIAANQHLVKTLVNQSSSNSNNLQGRATLAGKSNDSGESLPNQYKQQPLSNAQELLKKYNIKGDEIVNLDLGKYSNSRFIPQSLTKTLIGKAAGYALTKGDYFGAITFLCESVYPEAFYYDPATGGKRGTLVNTHPGITLSLQDEKTIRRMFSNTSLNHMTDEIVFKSIGPQGSRGVSTNMQNARLQVSDYYNMFQQIEHKYSSGAYSALKGRLDNHPMAKQLLSSGMSKDSVMQKIQSQLSPASYSVLQQLSYKYGTGGIRNFGKLLDHTISAGLDPDNQDKHLANGAKHIVYQYMNKNKKWVQDTRVMDIHRLFFTSGEKFSPELNLKLITGKKLNDKEEELVKQVAKKAGVSDIVKNGKLELPDSREDSMKSSQEVKLNTNAINKGVSVVNQNFKPVDTEISKPKVEHSSNQPEVHHSYKEPKVTAPKVSGGCTTVQCAMKNF